MFGKWQWIKKLDARVTSKYKKLLKHAVSPKGVSLRLLSLLGLEK